MGKIDFLDGGKTTESGYHKPLTQLYTSGFPLGTNATSMKAVQRGAGANMSVDISPGDVLLVSPSGALAYWGFVETAENVPIDAVSGSPRIDSVCTYFDTSVRSSASNDNPGALKFYVAKGTPAGSPTALDDSAIQTLLGASVPWTRIADVTVAANPIVNAAITDKRAAIKNRFAIDGGQTVDGSISPNKLVSGASTSWAQQTFTPTLTGITVGTGGSKNARYTQIGKMVFVTLEVVLGSSGFSVSTGVFLDLPVPARALSNVGSSNLLNGNGWADNTGILGYNVFVQLISTSPTSQVQFLIEATTANYGSVASITASAPFTWDAGDKLSASFSYEAV